MPNRSRVRTEPLHRTGALADTVYVNNVIRDGLDFDRTAYGESCKGYFTTGMPTRHYVELLLQDMGAKKYRHRTPWLAPVLPSMYEGLIDDSF